MGDLIAGGAGDPCWSEQCVPPPGRTIRLCRADCKIKVRNLKGIVENRSSLGGGRVHFKGGGRHLAKPNVCPTLFFLNLRVSAVTVFDGPSVRFLGTNQQLETPCSGGSWGRGCRACRCARSWCKGRVLILLRFFRTRDFSKQRPIELRPRERREEEGEKLLSKVKLVARGCHQTHLLLKMKRPCVIKNAFNNLY